MFRSIFKPYGTVWTLLNTITDVLGLSLLWCACSLPIITVGAATTALYDAAVRGIRYGQPGLYRRFFRTFKNELLTASLATLVWGVLLVFCSYVLAFLTEAGAENTGAAIMGGAYRAFMLFPIGAACWSCTILSRFTYGFRDLILISLRFLPAHLPSSLGLALLTWVGFRFCLSYSLSLTFAPALLALGWSVLAEPVFAKHGGGITQEPNPEKEAEEAGNE